MIDAPKATSPKKSLSNEEWESYVQLWKESGMSQQAFCRQENLNYNTFNYWKLRLIDKRCPRNDAAKRSANAKSPGKFVSIDSLPEQSAQLSLSLNGGIRLSWNGEVPPSYIKSLIEVLVV